MAKNKRDLPGFVNSLKGDESDINYEINALRLFERITSGYILTMFNALVLYQEKMGEAQQLFVFPQFNKRGNKKLKFTILSSTIKNLTILESILLELSHKAPKIVEVGEYTIIELF